MESLHFEGSMPGEDLWYFVFDGIKPWEVDNGGDVTKSNGAPIFLAWHSLLKSVGTNISN